MAKTNLTAQLLRELLRYSPETGEFSRAKTIGRWKEGESVGTTNKSKKNMFMLVVSFI